MIEEVPSPRPMRAASGRMEAQWRPGGHRKSQLARRSITPKWALSHFHIAQGVLAKAPLEPGPHRIELGEIFRSFFFSLVYSA